MSNNFKILQRSKEEKDVALNKNNIADMIFISLFVAVMVVCSQIVIPFGQVPFTLQTMAVFLTASLSGAKRATCSMFIYILLGAIGLPVFSAFSGGLGFLLGPTGGYIIGFFFTAFIVGIISEKLGKGYVALAVAMAMGLFVCYAIGTTWFCIIMKRDIVYGLLLCVIPYLIPDIIKIVCSVFLVKRLEKIIKM